MCYLYFYRTCRDCFVPSLDRQHFLAGISAAVQGIKEALTWAREGEEQKQVTSHHAWSKPTKAGCHHYFQAVWTGKGESKSWSSGQHTHKTPVQIFRARPQYVGIFVSCWMSRAWKHTWKAVRTKPKRPSFHQLSRKHLLLISQFRTQAGIGIQVTIKWG